MPAQMEPSEPLISSLPLMEMDPPSFDNFLIAEELDPPASVEVLTKARHYVNSV